MLAPCLDQAAGAGHFVGGCQCQYRLLRLCSPAFNISAALGTGLGFTVAAFFDFGFTAKVCAWVLESRNNTVSPARFPVDGSIRAVGPGFWPGSGVAVGRGTLLGGGNRDSVLRFVSIQRGPV